MLSRTARNCLLLGSSAAFGSSVAAVLIGMFSMVFDVTPLFWLWSLASAAFVGLLLGVVGIHILSA